MSRNGVADDDKAPLSALSLSTSCISIIGAAAAAVANAQASEGQVMMPRHHPLHCCCYQRTLQAFALLLPPPLPLPGQAWNRWWCHGIIACPVTIVPLAALQLRTAVASLPQQPRCYHRSSVLPPQQLHRCHCLLPQQRIANKLALLPPQPQHCRPVHSSCIAAVPLLPQQPCCSHCIVATAAALPPPLPPQQKIEIYGWNDTDGWSTPWMS
jgi:hypothetical protein